MAQRPSLDDYVDVAERILEFKKQHPDGSLQTVGWHTVEVGGKTFIAYQAAAYRTPDDQRPGHGTAWEPFPGPTPYTRDSELMNAETAAWGRAIVAVGIAANRKIASKQEVQARAGNHQAEEKPAKANGKKPAGLSAELLDELVKAKSEARLPDTQKAKDWQIQQFVKVGFDKIPADGQITLPIIRQLSDEQARKLIAAFREVAKKRSEVAA